MTLLGENITALLRSNLSRKETARYLGCSLSTVNVWASKLKSRSIDLDSIGGIGGKIIELRQVGNPYKSIAKRLGCSKSTVARYCALMPNDSDIKKKNIENHIGAIRNKSEGRIKLIMTDKRIENIITNNANRPKNGSSQRNRSTRIAKKMFLLHPVGYSCQLCGYNKYWGSLSLHHKDSKEKDIEISKSIQLSLNVLVQEAKKCVVLCHNCHQEVHAGIQSVDHLATLEYRLVPFSPKKWLDKQINNGSIPFDNY